MTSTGTPLALRRNAVTPTRLQLFGLDGAGTEVAMDITGYRLRLEVRMYAGAPGPALLFLDSTQGRIVIEDAATGLIEIDWTTVAAAIRALPALAPAIAAPKPRIDRFAYDLLLIAPDGSAQAVIAGELPVIYGVTTI